MIRSTMAKIRQNGSEWLLVLTDVDNTGSVRYLRMVLMILISRGFHNHISSFLYVSKI